MAMTTLAPAEAIQSWLKEYGGSGISAAHFLCDRHARIPDKVALFYEDAHGQAFKWTFRELQDLSSKLAGFLRLSLPGAGSPQTGMSDLDRAALIREVHVYGQSLPVGTEQSGAAQHIGLGTRLLEAAEEIARKNGYQRLAVIAAVGTRIYYEARGFKRGEYYLVKSLVGGSEDQLA